MSENIPQSVKDDVRVSTLDVSAHPQYMNHETVFKIEAQTSGVTALVGVHNTALGPALGGIRYKHYESEDAALSDVLRLSEAMTWKNAAGGLEHGGGKTVVMAPEGSRSPDNATLDVIAHGLNLINEARAVYYGAEDMNMGETALDYLAARSEWIKGATSADPAVVGGTPSPLTAIGVFECMKVAVKEKLGRESLEGVRVSMQGLGSVGAGLARLLHGEGAVLTAADISDAPFEMLKGEGIAVRQVPLDEIYDAPADVFAPNAIGGTLSNESIDRLHKAGVQIICGAANNQQEDQIGGAQARVLHGLEMLYCPDYIVNAGGVIWVAMVGKDARAVTEDIRTGVPRRFAELLALAKDNPEKDMATLAAEYSRRRVYEAEQRRAQEDAQVNAQRGNALWFILIGVALLAALTMILSRGGSSVDQSGDFEQRQVRVSQMLRYAKSIEAGIEQMRLRGVSENDISFENSLTATDYTNANCTTTDCRVFDVGGAGLSYTQPPAGVGDATEWIFSGANDIDLVGTATPDLVMFLPQVKTSVCAHINRLLETSYGGDESDVDFTAFTGTYTAAQAIDLAAGQEAGCVNYDNGGTIEPLFYYVLVKR